MWLADNIIMVSAIFLGLCVLVGLIAVGVTGLRLFFEFRRTRSRVSEPMEELTRKLEHTERLQAQLPDKQAQLDAAMADLQASARAVQILASHAGEAVSVLRSPMTYLR